MQAELIRANLMRQVKTMLRHILDVMKSNSIRKRIFTAQTSFAMLPLFLLTIIVILLLNEKTVNERNTYITGELNAAAESINHELNMYISKSVVLPNSYYVLTDIRGALKGDMYSVYRLQNNLKTFTSELQPHTGSEVMFSLYLHGFLYQDSAYIKSLEQFPKQEIMEKILTATLNNIVWDDGITAVRDQKYLVFYRNTTVQFKHNSILQVLIPYGQIENVINNIRLNEANSIILHQNSYGTVIYSNINNNDLDAVKIRFQEDQYTTFSSKFLLDGSRIVLGIPKANMRNKILIMCVFVLVTFVFVFLVMLLASKITSNKITKGLNLFINDIETNEKQLLDQNNFKGITVEDDDEISKLKKDFINVMVRMSNADKAFIAAEEQNRVLEIDLFQMRINPHLLYNSLSSVKISALRNSDADTAAIVDSLSNYYRLALNNGNKMISIFQETKLLKEYVNIINLSYRKKYKLNVNFDERLYDKTILNLLLQPLVENAIFHGLKGNDAAGEVSVEGIEENGYILIHVRDNGFGMADDTIHDLLQMRYTAARGGYGIKNTIQRIHLFYGEDCYLDIHSEIGVGTDIFIRIK